MSVKRIRSNKNRLGYTTRTINSKTGMITNSVTLKPASNMTETRTFLPNGKIRITNTVRDSNGFVTRKQKTIGGTTKIKKYKKSKKDSPFAMLFFVLILFLLYVVKLVIDAFYSVYYFFIG